MLMEKLVGFAAGLDEGKSSENKQKSNETPVLLVQPTGRIELSPWEQEKQDCGEDQGSGFKHQKAKMVMSHPNGEAKQAAGYWKSQMQKEFSATDVNLAHK